MGSTIGGLQPLQHVGSVAAASRIRSTGSTVVVHSLSRSVTNGVLQDQGSNCVSCIDKKTAPLSHQGSPSLSQKDHTIVLSGLEGTGHNSRSSGEARKEHGLSQSNFKGLMVEDSTSSSHCPAGHSTMMEMLSVGTF